RPAALRFEPGQPLQCGIGPQSAIRPSTLVLPVLTRPTPQTECSAVASETSTCGLLLNFGLTGRLQCPAVYCQSLDEVPFGHSAARHRPSAQMPPTPSVTMLTTWY